MAFETTLNAERERARGRFSRAHLRPAPSTLAFAALFAVFTVLSCHIQLASSAETASGQSILGSWTEHALSPFSPLDIMALIALWAAYSAVLHLFSLLAKRIGTHVVAPKDTARLRPAAVFACSFAMIAVAWLPYLLAFYPGGLYSDTITVIDQADGGVPLSNHHTLLYIFEWKACLRLAGLFGHGKNAALFAMTVYQSAVLAGSMAYFITWLHEKRLRAGALVAAQAFFMLFPLFPLNAISLWKDTLFSAFLFVFTLVFIDFCLDAGRAGRIKPLLCYVVCALLVAFSRNNGVYIVLACTAALAIVLWRKGQRPVLFSWVAAAVVSATLIMQGPVYSLLGLAGQFHENLGIPLQQVARAIVYEGDQLDQDEQSYFYSLLPDKDWKGTYTPLIVDSIKWDEHFDPAVIDEHKARFFEYYVRLGLEHPGRYFEAALLATCGFWDPAVGNNESLCCYQASFWPTYGRDDAGQTDLVESVSGFPLHEHLAVPLFPSNALFTWALLFSIAISLGVGNKRIALGMTPLAMLFVTLLVATPVAYSLRYCFALVVAVPLLAFAPWIENGASIACDHDPETTHTIP